MEDKKWTASIVPYLFNTFSLTSFHQYCTLQYSILSIPYPQYLTLSPQGWTYSIDFPRNFTADKRWNSCVRRRKWVRYRRYVALDTWSAVPPIHQDATQEPFIDISVGGGEVPGEDPDRLMVWAVTALGRVMVREEVDGTCPEGCRWSHVPTPPDKDVTSVSVGRSGRVWAVTWDGKVIVRTGINRECPKGEYWGSLLFFFVLCVCLKKERYRSSWAEDKQLSSSSTLYQLFLITSTSLLSSLSISPYHI